QHDGRRQHRRIARVASRGAAPDPARTSPRTDERLGAWVPPGESRDRTALVRARFPALLPAESEAVSDPRGTRRWLSRAARDGARRRPPDRLGALPRVRARRLTRGARRHHALVARRPRVVSARLLVQFRGRDAAGRPTAAAYRRAAYGSHVSH